MDMGIGPRLKMARRIAALSQEALAQQVGVSKMMISKYESGQVTPNSTMLLRLAGALVQPVEFFLRGPVVQSVQPTYRKRAALRGPREEAVRHQLVEWLERYTAAEALYPPGEQASFAFPGGFPMPVAEVAAAEHAAEALRAAWGLGEDPLEGLLELCEDQGIKVGLIAGVKEFDACTFWTEGDSAAPVIALRQGLPGDRQRFSVAHELGHIMLKPAPGVDGEKAASRFAGAFLVPRAAALRELGPRRTQLDVWELLSLKQKYGMSIQAWAYRAKDLGILDEAAAESFFRMMGRSGWRRCEPGPAVPAETPQRLLRLVRRAVAEDVITESRANELLGADAVQPLPQEADA